MPRLRATSLNVGEFDFSLNFGRFSFDSESPLSFRSFAGGRLRLLVDRRLSSIVAVLYSNTVRGKYHLNYEKKWFDF